jgi:murein DD-endopeptidase MepM/ murein hydrolase activator NlpD
VVSRRRLLAPILLFAFFVAAPSSASPSGGASVPPTGAGGGADGGARYGELPSDFERPAPARRPQRDRADGRRPRRQRPARRSRRGPMLAAFHLTRPRLFLYGRPARVLFRIEGRATRVRVRLSLLPRGGRSPVVTIPLGERSTGVTHSVALTGRERALLPQGGYTLRISARDRRGRGLRSAQASHVQDLDFFHYRFPVVGPFSYGGAGGRFGAERPGRRHQGQDVAAAEGTPIVAPRGGVIEAVQYQAAGAGHYVVLDGEGEDRDYVFMHLRTGSIPVREGQRVRTGQRLGEVGNTGRSFGAHLHFEVWVGGWFRGGRPVDPLPLLRAWDAWS